MPSASTADNDVNNTSKLQNQWATFACHSCLAVSTFRDRAQHGVDNFAQLGEAPEQPHGPQGARRAQRVEPAVVGADGADNGHDYDEDVEEVPAWRAQTSAPVMGLLSYKNDRKSHIVLMILLNK